MLIQQVLVARFAKLVRFPFGLGATKSRAVGFSLFCSFFALLLFSYSVQIDHVPHTRPIIPAIRTRKRFLAKQAQPNCAQAEQMPIRNPLYSA